MNHSLDRLIYMANQIARNLAHEHDPAAATADHIARFWDPRMKALILEHLLEGGEGLAPVTRQAVARLSRTPSPAE